MNILVRWAIKSPKFRGHGVIEVATDLLGTEPPIMRSKGGELPTTTFGYDARGNLASDGTKTYGYSSENLLTTATGGVALKYDPALRLYEISGAAVTRFAYDGADLIAEYDGAGTLLRRYVHGPGSDEPLVWYEGSSLTNHRWYHADERGSVIATSDAAGTAIAINSYDDHGIPGLANQGRFGYTGQTFLGDLGMNYYKARMYSPTMGRFMQTDPIGYGDGLNMYAYVGGDPVNKVDPSGMATYISMSCRTEYYESNSYDLTFGPAMLQKTVCTASEVGFDVGNYTPPQPNGSGWLDALQQIPICPASSNSVAGTIADYADKVGFAADGVTAGALAAGLLTAPTGAGPVIAGNVAGGAKVVGGAANIVGGVANIVDGNLAGAAGNAFSVLAGNTAGHFASKALVKGRMFGTLTAQGERGVQLANSGTSFGAQAGMKVGCGD